jgi:sarcosine oxidase, subunit gamma
LILKESAFVVDHGLKSLTALGHDAPVIVDIGAYRIEERVDVALASLAIRRDCQKQVLKAAKAAKLPLADPARATRGAIFSSFWLSPEMWMVEAPFASHEDIASQLKSIFGDTASITEQTDAWVRFDVSAPNLHALFERLCNVDVASAPHGFAVRTVIDHLGCYLIKRSETEITLYGPRSSAASLLHMLEVTAHSVV